MTRIWQTQNMNKTIHANSMPGAFLSRKAVGDKIPFEDFPVDDCETITLEVPRYAYTKTVDMPGVQFVETGTENRVFRREGDVWVRES